jgi:predicted nucleic acid-binding protein
MNADVFLDTNVLLYAIDENPAAASKRQRANQLIHFGAGAGPSRSLPSSS